ncbi:hypothetical protein JCM5353_000539 [Sporobolomyces roseus]
MDPPTSTPRIDHLSHLPNELLHQIVNEVYWKRKEGAEEGINLKKLTGPLSKRLLDFQRGGLYRNVEVRRWTGPRSFAVLVETVTKHPRIGSLVESLRFDIVEEISHDSRDDTIELTGPAIRAFFKLLPNLRGLTLAGSLSKAGTVLKIYSNSSTALHVLSLLLDDPNVVSISNEFTVQPNSEFEKFLSKLGPSELDKNQSSKVTDLCIFPRDLVYQAFGDHTSFIPHNFVTIHFCEPTSHLLDRTPLPLPSSHQPPSPSSSSLSQLSPGADQSRAVVRQLFSQLEGVILEGETSEISTPLLDVLPRFPIDDLALRIRNVVPILPLLNIVSKCPAISHLTLDYLGHPGSIGTRVSTINFDKIFPTIDLDTEDLTQDAMPDDWRYPHLPASWPIDDLLCLREKAVEAGIELDAENLFNAIEVQQAFREDRQLLDGLWEEWKAKGSKKSKKGGKSRKAKK